MYNINNYDIQNIKTFGHFDDHEQNNLNIKLNKILDEVYIKTKLNLYDENHHSEITVIQMGLITSLKQLERLKGVTILAE